MSAKTVKVAISLPRETMSEIEDWRHKLGLARSQAILEAVSLWLRKKHEEQQVKQYMEGYRKKPEKLSDIEPLYRAGLASFSRDHW